MARKELLRWMVSVCRVVWDFNVRWVEPKKSSWVTGPARAKRFFFVFLRVFYGFRYKFSKVSRFLRGFWLFSMVF